jgi:hypothetical protein
VPGPKPGGTQKSINAEYIRAPEPRDMGERFELFAKRKDGSRSSRRYLTQPNKSDSDVLVTLIIRDISERRK